MTRRIETYSAGDDFADVLVDTARRVYSDDPHWLPESVDGLRRQFSMQNPYFEKSTAQGWAVPGTARIVAFFDPSVHINQKKAAYFGFWETLNDPDANRRLFDEVKLWARRQDAEILYGPINFNTYNNYRIKTNFVPDEGCFIGEPYNPPYYADLLLQNGFAIDTQYFSQVLNAASIKRLYELKSPMLDAIKQLPLRIDILTEAFWMERLDELYDLVDSIFSQNFAYSAIPKENFIRQYGSSFARRMCPHTSMVILDPKDKIVGFCVGFPDFAPLCRAGAKERLELSEVNVRDHSGLLKNPVLLVKTAGVHPVYRNQGLLNAMALMVLEKGRAIYSEAIMCLIREGNFSAEFCSEVPSHIRTYALYSTSLK